eukprot:3749968-Pleurochrysis_carterae.AAC.5
MQATSVESKRESSKKCIAEALRAECGNARRRTQQRRRHDSAAALLGANSRKLASDLPFSSETQNHPKKSEYVPRKSRVSRIGKTGPRVGLDHWTTIRGKISANL